MFGSTNPFGQTSTSPFGQTQPAFGQTQPAFGQTQPAFGQTQPAFGQTQPAFGQTQPAFGQATTAANNPFAPKPFGSPTATFGQQTGSSFFGNTSTGAFGQQQPTQAFGTPSSSSSPFGSSTPAFGASPTPAFGATTSTIGSGSLFGQKPSFGGFGTSTSQSSPFGNTLQQTQPAFGGSTFGAPTTPAFGTATNSAFGAPTAPTFGSTSPSTFGGSSTPMFGSTAFGSSTPAFANSGTTAFGVGSTPGFGASSTPSFGTSTSAFNFGASPSPGQTAASFGSSPFGTTSAFGAQTSPFGSQPAAPTFGQAPFGNQTGGTRIKSYAQTPDADGATSGNQPAAKLDSISAMPEYTSKSHEELRWEDYQRGDKGGPNPSGAPASSVSLFPSAQQNNMTGAFNQTPTNPFQTTVQNNPFKPTGFASTSASVFNTSFNNPSATSSNPFTMSTGSTFSSSAAPSFFSNTSGFAPSTLFGTSSTTTSPFNTSLSLANNTQSAGLQSSPAFAQQPFGQQSSAFPSSTPAFPNLFNTPISSNLFGSGSSFSTSTFQPSAPAQTSGIFSFQPNQPASAGGFTGFSNTTNQAPSGQPAPSQSNMVMKPAPVSNPFGTLPAMPQMSIGNGRSSPSVQYGISSLPVAEKPLVSRILSMAVPRHLSQRRIKMHPRKYDPRSDGKVPFFDNDEEFTATPKADAFFIPRENPRNLIIRPIDQWPSRSAIDRRSVPKDSSDLDNYKDASAENERDRSVMSPSKPSLAENGNHRDCEPRAVTQHVTGTSVEKLIPKLPHAEYFTEPSLEELAAKERAEPGYCCRVRDFVVGRHGYGSIKFLGETDVRGLDLESIVEFNNREVIVYKDDSRKPPVGEGLNKAAEVTLLNIKCMNKKTGEQYREGPRVDKYKEMLVKKAEEQGAEFISFVAAKGEWKFRVKHFSAYGLW